MDPRLSGKRIILASASPRRRYLLKELGLNFESVETHVDEDYPEGLTPMEIAMYLARLKASAIDFTGFDDKTIVITADTIVMLGSEILGKPSGYHEAADMLRKLSGRTHEVITGVSLQSIRHESLFFVVSSVTFKELTQSEIDYYIENFRPFDKAGGYGIQEWIGYIGIDRIDGSFYNVMGMPVRELYEALLTFD